MAWHLWVFSIWAVGLSHITARLPRFWLRLGLRLGVRPWRRWLLAQFLDRVEQVNRDPYFLGKVVRVVLFGSTLKPEVERLSDVDVAVELAAKEADGDRAREQNYRRAEELAEKGKQFRNVIECELCWYFETRHFLKGGSRVIAMADYKAEKALVLAVPHRVLLGENELPPDDPKPKSKPMVRSRRPRDCPF